MSSLNTEILISCDSAECNTGPHEIDQLAVSQGSSHVWTCPQCYSKYEFYVESVQFDQEKKRPLSSIVAESTSWDTRSNIT